MKKGSRTKNRGIALLIVLLVTALLIALIFEFSYATRISLNSAVNFRDSQRAYFLARAGVYASIKYRDTLIKKIPQDEWQPVPFIGEEDTQVLIKWQDEQGKFNINTINSNPGHDWIEKLFSDQGVEMSVYDKVAEMRKDRSFNLIAELHAAMSDEDYQKVIRFLSVFSDNTINFNTAPAEVFIAMGCNENSARAIVELRKRELLDTEKLKPYLPPSLATTVSSNNLPSTIAKFTVYSHATVGGYTKEIVAIIGSDQPYWRAL